MNMFRLFTVWCDVPCVRYHHRTHQCIVLSITHLLLHDWYKPSLSLHRAHIAEMRTKTANLGSSLSDKNSKTIEAPALVVSHMAFKRSFSTEMVHVQITPVAPWTKKIPYFQDHLTQRKKCVCECIANESGKAHHFMIKNCSCTHIYIHTCMLCNEIFFLNGSEIWKPSTFNMIWYEELTCIWVAAWFDTGNTDTLHQNIV